MNSIFIARQPIVTASKRLYAYELLFRDFSGTSSGSGASVSDDFYATSRVAVNTLNQFGMERLVGDRVAFINADKAFILSDFIMMLPKDRFVIEILESVEVDDTLCKRVGELERAGYRFALDDAVLDETFFKMYGALLPYMDIVKIDIRENRIEQVKKATDELKRHYPDLLLLAEKVETREEYHRYTDVGCSLFQGYFFAKPQISSRRSLDPGKGVLLELTTLLNDEESGPREIASAFERAPDLSLQLLQFLNSAHFSFHRPIESIVQAVTMLGRRELVRWTYLLSYANSDAGEIESSPLASLAAFRSRLLRKIARLHGSTPREEDMAAFLGMLSLADTLFGIRMEELLRKIAVDVSIKAALLNGDGFFGKYLEISKMVENGDIKGSIEIAGMIGIDPKELENSVVESF